MKGKESTMSEDYSVHTVAFGVDNMDVMNKLHIELTKNNIPYEDMYSNEAICGTNGIMIIDQESGYYIYVYKDAEDLVCALIQKINDYRKGKLKCEKKYMQF